MGTTALNISACCASEGFQYSLKHLLLPCIRRILRGLRRNTEAKLFVTDALMPLMFSGQGAELSVHGC